MSLKKLAILALPAALLFATPLAHAQPEASKCMTAEFDSRSEPLDEMGPFAGGSYKTNARSAGGAATCRIVTFYRLPAKLPPATTSAERRTYAGKTATPFFAARYVDDTRAINFKARWTDQERCPALVPQLAKLEPLLAPKLTADGPYRGFEAGAANQAGLRFWVTGQIWPQTDPDHTLDIAIEGGGNAAFGQWVSETFKALETCWSPDAPVVK